MKSSINKRVIVRDGKETTKGAPEEVKPLEWSGEQASGFKSFADVEKDFQITYQVNGKAVSQMGLDIEIRTVSEMSESALKSAKSTIRKTLKAFEAEFGAIPASEEPRKITLYLFDDKRSLADSMQDMGRERSSSGICWPDHGKIYAAQLGKNKVGNLAHELTHQLEYYATGGLHSRDESARFLGEGIADYIQYIVQNNKKVNLDFMGKAEGILKLLNEDAELREARTISEIASIVEARKIQQKELKSFFRKVEKKHVSTGDEVLDLLRKHEVVIKNTDYARIRRAENVEEALDVVKEYNDSNNYNKLVYGMNRAIVKYLQENKPGIISETFNSSYKASLQEKTLYGDSPSKAILPEGVDALSAEFMSWLSENTVGNFSNNHEMLSAVRGERIGYANIIDAGEVKKAEVFTVKLEDKDHREVGTLSPVEHISSKGVIRVLNTSTNDLIRIDSKYYNLKAVDTIYGRKYVYCDSEGNEYFRSAEDFVVNGMAEVLGKYDRSFEDLRLLKNEMHWAYLDHIAAMDVKTQKALFSNIDHMYALLKKSIPDITDERYRDFVDIEGFTSAKLGTDVPNSEILEVILKMIHAYETYTSEIVQSLVLGVDTGTEEAGMLGRILRSLVYIDPGAVVGVGPDSFEEAASSRLGNIITLEINGKGDLSAVSAYGDYKKIGELPTNVGVYTRYTDSEGRVVDRCIVSNTLKGLHTTYPGSPLIVVTEDPAGGKRVNLVSDVEVDDVRSEQAQVEVNRFLDLVSKGTGHSESFPVSKGISIVTHDERKNAQLDQEKAYAVKGPKVEDRGTEDVSDDRYEASVKMGDKMLIQKLSSMEFYISEDRKDDQGNTIDAPNLFIGDRVVDKRFQLPESITHLKLVRDERENIFLVPCTKTGNINPHGMPEDIGQYAYIDPIFAYGRMEMESVSRHARFELIDFSKYVTGKLFKIAPDINDPSVPKDSNGNPLRTAAGNTYMTRVAIIDESSGEKIGELASAPTFFQGDVFLSFDRSYSHSDFISSLYHHEVEVENSGPGLKRLTLSGEGDLGTDSGYSNYYSFYQRAREGDQQDEGDQQNPVSPNVHDTQQTDTVTHVFEETEHSLEDKTQGGHCVLPQEVKIYRDITYSESTELGDTSITMKITGHKVVDGEDVPVYSLSILKQSTGSHVQFPESITHLKVVTLSGKKFLVPCTSNGSENPVGMMDDIANHRYINPILVHENVISRGYGGAMVLVPVDLNMYSDNTLFAMRHAGEKFYSTPDILPVGSTSAVHLYHGNTEVGVLSSNMSVSYGGLLENPKGSFHDMPGCSLGHGDMEPVIPHVDATPENSQKQVRDIVMYMQVGTPPEGLKDHDHYLHHRWDGMSEHVPNVGGGAMSILGMEEGAYY
ncbi:hypothetical protein [Anaplasma bovis]|uniref:hypothetical protein n=1 Tax=Anaplasma bovis TaxID=186733 RepID=UPI002FF3739F